MKAQKRSYSYNMASRGRMWCQCKICKNTSDDCGNTVNINTKSHKLGYVCSNCRRGNHCNDSKEKYPFKRIKNEKI